LKHVVIVGRPNVGKSTLFNRLAGRRRALTHDLPGMTRDRLTLEAALDDGRRYRVTDTGGLEFGDEPMSAFASEIREQAETAIAESDLVLFVVDGPDGVLSEDRDIARALREGAKKLLLVVNKIDKRAGEERVNEFHELGLDRLVAISAEHGTNLEEVVDARVVVRQMDGDGVFMAFVSKINLVTGDPANVFLRPASAGTGR